MPETFDAWLRSVDKWVWLFTGCSVHDLPDVPLRDWWNCDISALSAARRAIRNANDEDE